MLDTTCPLRRNKEVVGDKAGSSSNKHAISYHGGQRLLPEALLEPYSNLALATKVILASLEAFTRSRYI